MHLTPANLAYFLMDRSLLGTDEIVGGRVSILDASRRNRNFKVIRHGAPGLFVKQMRDMQTDAMLTLKREAACYELARDIPELARIMPRLVRYLHRHDAPRKRVEKRQTHSAVDRAGNDDQAVASTA